MKRFLFGFLAALFLILNTIPYLHILADSSMTDSQYQQIGAFALSSLITTGEATELDFSDYTDSDTDFLLALGELVVTGDPSGLVECGLDWLGETIDDVYDSAIQSIRTWEYNNLPNSFYYWFIDENPPYELAPSYNNIRDLSQPLRRLLTPPDDNDSSNNVPPDLDFLNNTIDWLWDSTDQYTFASGVPFYSSQNNFFPTTYVNDNWSFVSWEENGVNNNNFSSISVSPVNLIDLYITDNGDSVSIRLVGGNELVWHTSDLQQYRMRYVSQYSGTGYLNVGSPWESISNPYAVRVDYRTSFDTIYVCANYIYRNFRHINIYYNNEPWVIVGDSGNEYPIIIPDQLTIWNDQPLEYTFPPDTYIDLPDLTNIITNAINNSGVVMWSDIADCFVDVNGQTAVAVTKIVRNDYDNLYMEQYPYPAMLIGMTEQTKFNEHLLDNSHTYLSPMGTVVQETVNVLPSELVGVLAIGAILTIFAVIINRLLE